MRSYVGTLRVNPGTEESVKCGACGAKMKVKRNFGPTSSVEAMGGGRHLHDRFECPNQREDWHNEIVALIEETENTESKTLQKIIKKDIDEILKKARKK